jgi:hypothetical protein
MKGDASTTMAILIKRTVTDIKCVRKGACKIETATAVPNELQPAVLYMNDAVDNYLHATVSKWSLSVRQFSVIFAFSRSASTTICEVIS